MEEAKAGGRDDDDKQKAKENEASKSKKEFAPNQKLSMAEALENMVQEGSHRDIIFARGAELEI